MVHLRVQVVTVVYTINFLRFKLFISMVIVLVK